MKFWLSFIILCSAGASFSHVNGENLANAIHIGIVKIREAQAFNSYASTSLSEFNVEIEKRASEKAKIRQTQKNKDNSFDEKSGALAYLEDVLSNATNNEKCKKGLGLLEIRVEKAKQEKDVTLSKAKQWLGYVQKNYCFGILYASDVEKLNADYLLSHYPHLEKG
ncbi:hypothetical protein BM525_21130 (plasmid) [Alteromonas mediterranea]|uniref:Uncharacterized protein n=1 Tax=Alteromonas mediterranea TaxID=314275 RepID=A0AAC9JEX4_9ALTE|nr:hypothetical protein [Alteromonas mediterranea]APD92364.1 hypothetical protein BM524_20910 [Alteromonas mediterranea]APE00225.1 hypothetical protein BM525_21130 [Alteromonas mediterranea]